MQWAKWSLLFFLLVSFVKMNATHLRCGEITVEQVGPASSRIFRIRVVVFTNTYNTVVLMGGDQDFLDFGDGSAPALVPEIGPGHPNYSQVDPAHGIAKAYYEIEHVYSESGRYVVSYSEPNRNGGILNFDNSINTEFYVETMFIVSSTRNYSSPRFLAPPLFKAKAGEHYTFSIGAEDPNGYSLFYKLVTPLRSKQTTVDNYQLPDETSLNLYNGLVTWEGMFLGMARPGEYLLAVKVFQLDGDEVVGYVLRDIQIIAEGDSQIESGISDNRDLDENNRIYVEQGNTYKIKIFAEGDGEITLQSFSAFDFQEEPEVVSFETYDSLNGEMKVGLLTITPDAASVRDNPYVISVRGGFGNPSGAYYNSDINYLFYTKDVELHEPIVLGVKEERSVSKIHPNPTNGFIKITNTANGQVRVVDQSGRIVLRTTPTQEGLIDLSYLPQGLYLIETTGSNKLVSRERVMKE